MEFWARLEIFLRRNAIKLVAILGGLQAFGMVYATVTGDEEMAATIEEASPTLERIESMLIELGRSAPGIEPAYLASLADDVDERVALTGENARLRTQLETEQALRANQERSTDTELRALRSDLTSCRADYADATSLVAALQQQQENPDDQVCLSASESAAYRLYMSRRDELRGVE